MNTLLHTTHFPFPTLQLFAGFVTRPILDTDTWEDTKKEFDCNKILADHQVIQGGGTGSHMVGMLEDQLKSVGAISWEASLTDLPALQDEDEDAGTQQAQEFLLHIHNTGYPRRTDRDMRIKTAVDLARRHVPGKRGGGGGERGGTDGDGG